MKFYQYKRTPESFFTNKRATVTAKYESRAGHTIEEGEEITILSKNQHRNGFNVQKDNGIKMDNIFYEYVELTPRS